MVSARLTGAPEGALGGSSCGPAPSRPSKAPFTGPVQKCHPHPPSCRQESIRCAGHFDRPRSKPPVDDRPIPAVQNSWICSRRRPDHTRKGHHAEPGLVAGRAVGEARGRQVVLRLAPELRHPYPPRAFIRRRTGEVVKRGGGAAAVSAGPGSDRCSRARCRPGLRRPRRHCTRRIISPPRRRQLTHPVTAPPKLQEDLEATHRPVNGRPVDSIARACRSEPGWATTRSATCMPRAVEPPGRCRCENSTRESLGTVVGRLMNAVESTG